MLLVTRNWTELTILIWRKIYDIAQHSTIRDITAYITRNLYCGDIVPVFHHHATHETYTTHATACVIFLRSANGTARKITQAALAACTRPTDQVTSEACQNVRNEVTSKDF